MIIMEVMEQSLPVSSSVYEYLEVRLGSISLKNADLIREMQFYNKELIVLK